MPWQQILVFIEAIVRVYNRYGRRDNLYKARIKILVKAEGQKFVDAVQRRVPPHPASDDSDGAAHLIPQAELDRVAASFQLPAGVDVRHAGAASGRRPTRRRPTPAGWSATCTPTSCPATAR